MFRHNSETHSSKKPFPLLPLAGIGLFLLYFIWVAARPQNVLWSLDEGGKYIYLQSILQTGRVNTPLLYPAANLDPNLEFVPLYFSIQRGGQLYSWWPIGLPLVSLPFYQLFGWMGLYLIPAAAGAAAAVLTGLITRRLTCSARLGLAACLLTGLTTPITFYSTMFWEHTLSTAFCLAALLALLSALDHNKLWLGLLAGALASISIFFRLDTAPLLVGFGLVIIAKQWKQALAFGLGTAITSLPWLWLNQWTSGNPLGPTYLNVTASQPFAGLGKVGLKFLPYALFNPPRADTFPLSSSFLLAASLLLLVGVLAALLRNGRWLSLLCFAALTALCAWVLLQPSQYQAVHGILLVAPQIIFGIYILIIPKIWKESPYPALLLSALGCYAAVYIAKAWVSAGGLQWGPRYLMAIYPLMMIAAIVGLANLNRATKKPLRRWAAAAFLVACLVGLGFQMRGILTVRTLMGFYARSIPAFAEKRDAPVILTWEGYAMDVPNLYWQGNVLSLSSNKPNWDLWNNRAREMGLKYYYTADLLTVDNAPLDVIARRLKETPSGVIFKKVIVTP